ncbi:MAG TPA: prepilin-type N-terminal cleavage/methylation domain-containing protein [Bacteroidales bacterium]|jgi:prepilin-type N-terminal cleavage/methylation domain-containing protein|nr:prepilin-type N-terminal cleavage/methylation domain-containing protein [Bacteroidales bacterium]
MIKKQAGFTMVELLITMVVFIFVMAAGSQIFSGLLTQFKQQSKIAETNMEGLVGLEMLRQDLEHVGYGLPWIIPAGVTYSESSSNNPSGLSGPAPSTMNDSPLAPRAVISGNNVTYGGANSIFTGSDYLVIKAVNIALDDASQRWTTLKMAPFSVPDNPRQWIPASENLESTDRVIVISPGATDTNARRLVDNGGTFYTTFGNVTNSPWPPTDNLETRLVYGINRTSDPAPVRPFNRADYFISRVNNIVPQRCAPDTGVLVKAILNHGGAYDGVFPLLDCVADMQVVYALDNDENGSFEDGVGTPPDAYSDNMSALTAQQVRNRVKEIRVYVLSHEGQRDQNYTYPSETIGVPAAPDPGAGLGRTFDIKTAIGDPDYQHYRWKLYTIVVKPIDLR